jgi:hypothetical protein
MQSSKGKASSDDTCFLCKESKHWENECELKKTIEQMKTLEKKFKGLTQSKNKGKSRVNLMEKEHVKQLDSNSESSTTNVEEVIEIHLTETNNVCALKEVDHRLGFF